MVSEEALMLGQRLRVSAGPQAVGFALFFQSYEQGTDFVFKGQ